MLAPHIITILLIDDDVDLVEMTRQLLELEDYHILSASDGVKAIELLGGLKDYELPDLILLDFNMPEMNGESVARTLALTHQWRHIPVVMMTGNPDLRDVMDRVDAYAFLSKPVEPSDLRELALNYTHRHQNARASFLT